MAGMNREAWLNAVVREVRPWFDEIGYPLPELIHVSVGFPAKSALSARKQRIGECWSKAVSADGGFQIFISPVLADPLRVADVLVHELVHAAVGTEAGHKGPFITAMRKIGLAGKPTATTAGDALRDRLKEMLEFLPAYPHSELKASGSEKKQSTRMLKASCKECGYTIRLTKKWAMEKGAVCPTDGPMEVDGLDQDEEDKEDDE